MKTHFGHPFDSAILNNNIIGVQFHPEKSHKFGMKLFKNFIEKC
jgi:glutamine amidotransferase